MSQSKKKVFFKVVLVGDSGVGKTSLLNRYVDNSFTESHKATIGADVLIKEIEIENTLITLQILDTAGQERFQSLITSFYRGSDGLILVYDITNIKSFKSLDLWFDEFKINSNIKNIKSFPIIVLGNKCDLANINRKVSSKDISLWCQNEQNNISTFETSAKDNLNVKESFDLIAQKCLQRNKKNSFVKMEQCKVFLKVLILGDSGVGKTSLMNRFVDNKFSKFHKTTIGADILTKQIKISKTTVTLQILDTAGQERFQSLVTSIYRGTDALILVFDITNIKTFESLESWFNQFRINHNIKNINSFPIIVLGNKCDLRNVNNGCIKVPKKDVELWCENELNNNFKYFESSAKDGTNVNESFYLIAEKCLQNRLNEKYNVTKPQTLDLSHAKKRKNKSYCCNII